MIKENKNLEQEVNEPVVTVEKVKKTDAQIEAERVAGLKTKLRHRWYFLIGLTVMFTVVIIFAAVKGF